VRWRNRPDGRNPLEGHLSQARAGDRRNRARRNRRPDDRDEVRLRAVTVRPPPAGAGSGCPLESATLRNVYVHLAGAKREGRFRVCGAARIRGLRAVAIASLPATARILAAPDRVWPSLALSGET